MSESKDGRANIDRMTGHLVKQGMSPEAARAKAVDGQLRKDARDAGQKNWRRPYGQGGE